VEDRHGDDIDPLFPQAWDGALVSAAERELLVPGRGFGSEVVDEARDEALSAVKRMSAL
jgi:hypothetical protein